MSKNDGHFCKSDPVRFRAFTALPSHFEALQLTH